MNMPFISKSKATLPIFRACVVVMVFVGSIASLSIVWDLADLFMALMAIVNLIAIVLLGKYAIAALRDYNAQKAKASRIRNLTLLFFRTQKASAAGREKSK